jgi:hypothetical protein
MSRVLRRPMFRGGIANSDGVGITFGLNDGYATGGRVNLQRGGISRIPGIDDLSQVGIYQPPSINFAAINPDTGLPYTQRDRLKLPPTVRQRAEKEGVTFTGDAREQMRQEQEFLKKEEEKKLAATKLLTEKKDEDNKKIILNKNTTTEPVKSDEEVIKDYMEMFKSNLATDKDELNSQRYLELAKFGLNLMSQPGGLPGGKRDLLGAIGRAGMPAIEGLSKIAAEERSGEKQAKILGFQAALKKLDNPLLEKYKIQSKLSGIPLEDVVKSDIQTAQAINSKQNLIKSYSEILDSNDPINNRRIAETIVNMNKDIAQFQKHLDPLMVTGKEKKGQYYYFGKPGPNGELVGRWDGKKFLLPSDEGFI